MNGIRNPFATRYTRPGALPYHFPPGTTASQLVETLLAKYHGWAQIVGPHGSGKSTLLHSLVAELQHRGKQPWVRTLHAGERRLSLPASETGPWTANTLVVIDGFEQLSWWSRWRLAGTCRRQRAGLLVTTHSASWFPRLPCLFETRTSTELLGQLVTQLVGDAHPPATAKLAELYARHGGNLREVLFELYDAWKPGSGGGRPE